MWPAEPVNRPIAAIGPCESAGHQSPAIASLIFSFCFLSSARRAVSGARFARNACHWLIGRRGVEVEEIIRRIEFLRQEHRDLDAAIEALGAAAAPDHLQLARIKKRKLRLKDEIALLEDQLIPDIIA